MSATIRLLIIVVVLLIVFESTNADLIAFDCSNVRTCNNNYASCLYSYSPRDSCDIKETGTISGRLVERPGPKTVVGYRCLVNSITNVGFYTNHGEKSRDMVQVSRDVCLEAHETGFMKISGVQTPHLDFNRTIELTMYRSGYYPYIESRYEISLSVHFGTVDFLSDIVSFDLGVDCDFSLYRCEGNQFGQIFWTSDVHSGPNRTDLFRGKISLFSGGDRSYAVIDNENEYFAMQVHALNHLNDTEITPRQNAFWVAHPDWFIDVINDSFPSYRAPLDRFKDSAVIYSEYIYKAGEKKSIVTKWCRQESESLNGPMSFEKLLDLPRKNLGYKEIVVSTSYYGSSNCHRTMVSRLETDRCFDGIPVKYGVDDKLFLKRNSRILVPNAESISCPTVPAKTIACSTVPITAPMSCPIESSDPVKTVLIVLVSFWGLAMLVRLATVVYFVYKSHQKDNQVQSSAPDERLLTLENVYDVLKPPFLGKYPESWKPNGMPKVAESETAVSHDAEAENLYDTIS